MIGSREKPRENATQPWPDIVQVSASGRLIGFEEKGEGTSARQGPHRAADRDVLNQEAKGKAWVRTRTRARDRHKATDRSRVNRGSRRA